MKLYNTISTMIILLDPLTLFVTKDHKYKIYELNLTNYYAETSK